MTVDGIKRAILTRLVNRNMWGGKHTEHVLAGLPKHLIGSKDAEQALKELLRDGWILASVKTREQHYSLNPREVKSIRQYLER